MASPISSTRASLYPATLAHSARAWHLNCSISSTKRIVFQLPLFDSATGSGSNASFNIVAFVSVVVTDFQTSGAQADRSLTLQFVAAVAEGVCCDAFGIDTGTRVLQICAVDPTDLTACPVT